MQIREKHNVPNIICEVENFQNNILQNKNGLNTTIISKQAVGLPLELRDNGRQVKVLETTLT
jgi:hypothetical protein